MRVMVIVKATKESEEANSPVDAEGAAAMFEAMGKYNEELIQAGILLTGDGLRPSKFGRRIHFSGTKRSVTDGPFAETRELVAGFWIWQVRSMDEAVEWAKRCPNPMPGPSDLEIRPFWEAEDFGPEIAAEVNAQREKLGKRS
ncbi:MAG: YciI family protein [Thermoanaerobaculia bacterium]|mgnify:FL=1|nr:YciI family protein [Thermoanaerobaculia bacterium]